ncbi:MAG: GntR family transcriptional regulator [Kiritimatiellae bacterium]|nr:GntR family transcriptional regulator [Kiritimatiellia bacterium]
MAVANELRDNILAGRYAPGAVFPSVKMLCRRFGISHLTAAKVIETLKGRGLVRTRNGVGTFVSRRMKSIGLIIVSMIGQIDILPPIAREISRLAQKNGVGLDFADMATDFSEKDDALVIEAAHRMADAGVSGAIFRPADFGAKAAAVNREVLNIFSRAGIPLLLLDFDIGFASNDLRHDFVGVDNREVGEIAGRHLLERGIKSVAFVAWSEMCCNVEQRLEGLLTALACKRSVRFVGQYGIMGDGAAMAKKWKTRLPDAIVCSSDLVAAHVLKLLSRIGKSCPNDVLLTGVDDVDLATFVSPPLTTVHQPCEAIARAALETLLWRMENHAAETRRILVATDLVIRESTTR